MEIRTMCSTRPRVFGYYCADPDTEDATRFTDKATGEAYYQDWARESGRNPIAQVHWLCDPWSVHDSPLRDRPAGAELMRQLESGDLAILAGPWSFASLDDYVETCREWFGRGITLLDSALGHIWEPSEELIELFAESEDIDRFLAVAEWYGQGEERP
jgi:hypothetical protein